MITYCQMCRGEIDAKRRRKHSRTCSPDCQKRYRKEMLQERNERICHYCGKTKRQRSTGTPFPTISEVSHATV